jgi:hypothetical protein
MRQEEEIGPGTSVYQSQSWSRRTLINASNCQTYDINTDAPSPDAETIGVRKIGKVIPPVHPPDVNDPMISSPNRPVGKRPHSVFQRSLPRVAFDVQSPDASGPEPISRASPSPFLRKLSRF